MSEVLDEAYSTPSMGQEGAETASAITQWYLSSTRSRKQSTLTRADLVRGLRSQIAACRTRSAEAGGWGRPSTPRRTAAQAIKIRKSGTDPSLSHPRVQKIIVPGPGAYSVKTNREGRRSSLGSANAWSFGSRRSHMDDVTRRVCSPGPVYNCQEKLTSTHRSHPNISIARGERGSRLVLDGYPSNSAARNPGPTDYRPRTVPNGSSTDAGGDSPRFKFSKAKLRVAPCHNLGATAMISQESALRENLGIFSPGPVYLPAHDYSSLIDAPPSWTLAPRCKTAWEGMQADSIVCGPGPAFQASKLDRRGVRLWGTRKAPFCTAEPRYSPEISLARSPYISEDHQRRVNHALHSPGPIYHPNHPEPHHSGPAFDMCGPEDRFYTRDELGRC